MYYLKVRVNEEQCCVVSRTQSLTVTSRELSDSEEYKTYFGV